ncbi:MAG: anaerobic ribonucleoside-triphosphate reductase activating protein [Thermotogota bacterium]
MKFAGIEKLSLTDYPKKVAATVFTSGCNFSCKYCHNKSLIKKRAGTLDESKVFAFFKKRSNMLDALVITGGEPTLYTHELTAFCRRFKKHFPQKYVKIDTNGSHPEMIKELSDVADFCAMDFKALDYSAFSSIDLRVIQQSLQEIKLFPDFEIRVTLFPEYINFDSLKKMLNMVKFNEIKKITLQQYRPLEKNEKIYEKKEIEAWVQKIDVDLKITYRGF